MSDTTAISTIPATSDVVAAMFTDGDAARAARDALTGAGIPPEAIDVVDRGAATTEAPDPHGHGVWARLHEMFTPHAHSHGYAEGVERGHVMVFVRAPAAQQPHVMHLLEGLQPLDVAQRAQDWSEAGWTGVHRSQVAAGEAVERPPLLFADTAYPDHIPATGLLNENDRARGLGMPLVNPMGIEVAGVRTSGSARVRRYEFLPEDQVGRAA